MPLLIFSSRSAPRVQAYFTIDLPFASHRDKLVTKHGTIMVTRFLDEMLNTNFVITVLLNRASKKTSKAAN